MAGMSIPIGPLTRGMLEIVKSTMLGDLNFLKNHKVCDG